MNRHVDHLLAAYVSGDLPLRSVAEVTNHVRVCERCLKKLAVVERTYADVRFAATSAPMPAYEAVSMWWPAIRSRSQAPARWLHETGLFPVLLCIIMLMLPLLVGPSLVERAAARDSSTGLPPNIDIALSPADDIVPTIAISYSFSAATMEPEATTDSAYPQVQVIAAPPAPTNP